MTIPALQWTTPAPLWPEVINGGAALTLDANAEFAKPAILRFASDTFMDDFLTLLENAPSTLGARRAVRETWRGPATTPEPVKALPLFRRTLERRKLALQAKGALAQTTTALPAQPLERPLKLYQPAHMRYYLLTACLVCRLPGLPDRLLDTATQERVSFVVRRLLPNAASVITPDGPQPADEYAFVNDGRTSGWRKIVGAGNILAPGEEQNPLFAVTFTQADERKRRLFAGLVPVGKREAYLGAGELQDDPSNANPETAALKPGQLPFMTQVIEPWKRLIETANAAGGRLNPLPTPPSDDRPPEADERTAFLKATREQLQLNSWYILLDLAELLRTYLPDVWDAMLTGAPETTGIVQALQATTINQPYVDALIADTTYADSDVRRSLAAALAAIDSGGSQLVSDLEAATAAYDRNNPNPIWPEFLFPLADPEHGGPLPPAPGGTLPSDPLAAKLAHIEHLGSLLAAALPTQASEPAPPLPLAAQPVKDPSQGWFQIRCVFERPNCDPRLAPPLVSAATSVFQMAGYFDPDAPARPIRIALPIDTTPAGLRKFDKNTAFMISDVLCGQIERAKGLSLGDLVRSVLPWPLHKDLSVPEKGPCKDDGTASLGMICSLSIPIITICALLLLMIIVNLLDIIFRWIPYFILCFPLPGFSAKESS